MRRLVLIIVLLAAGLALASPGALADPTTIGATAHDDDDSLPGMALNLSRHKVDPGRAVIHFHNSGADDHDMRIQREGSEGDQGTVPLGEGEDATLEVRLHRASHYVLWCSLADHRERGMEATLKVGKRR